MESRDSLDFCVELLESFALCDSLIGASTPGHCPAPGPETESGREKYERIDTASVTSSPVSQPVSSEAGLAETHRGSEGELPCTSPSCSSAISRLERKVRLLESQNAQLIVNACSMYNTLIKHIEFLREELRRRDALPVNV